MKHYLTLSVAITALAAVFWASVACASSGPSLSLPPVPAAPATQGAFKVENLAVNPAQVNAGVDALITATITNIGAEESNYVGRVRIDNTIEQMLPTFLYSKETTILAGTAQLLSVSAIIRNPGKYRVLWGDVTRELVVNSEEPEVYSQQNAAPSLAPDFTGVDVLTGKKISLTQYSGSAILLNFVNYGCNPQVNEVVSAELLAIKALKARNNNFVPVSVFCGCCPLEVLRQFAKQNNFDWPWILDTDNSIVAKYARYLSKFGYPTLIFIDKDQQIIDSSGYIKPAVLEEKLNKILPAQVK